MIFLFTDLVICCRLFVMSCLEGSHSGLVRVLGEHVWGNSPGVRISPLPPSVIIVGYNKQKLLDYLSDLIYWAIDIQ